MTVIAHVHPEHLDAHRHTSRCHWDLRDARWRCAGARDTGDVLPRLPRALVARRRPIRPERVDVPPTARRVRTGAQPGLDDGC